jgi:hypothetical protein
MVLTWAVVLKVRKLVGRSPCGAPSFSSDWREGLLGEGTSDPRTCHIQRVMVRWHLARQRRACADLEAEFLILGQQVAAASGNALKSDEASQRNLS